MRIAEPVTDSDFQQYYALRWKILREPWQQPRGSERDPLDENNSTHLMLVDARQRVAGVGRLHFNGIREAQIRYMAIDALYQRQGLGSLLLQALESRARLLGADRVVLDARESALGFYRKHGYLAQRPAQVLFEQIPHVRMMKRLQDR